MRDRIVLSHTTDAPLRLLAAFHQVHSGTPNWLLRVPDRDMWIAATCMAENKKSMIVAPDMDARTSFDERSARLMQTCLNRPLPRWARYCAAVTLLLADHGLATTGIIAAAVGDEPPGPRYEHALGMAYAALCLEAHNTPYNASTLVYVVERAQQAYL